jgi:1,2-phenylacetyl-CoA epoxidase catalytic subunit
MGRSAAMTAPSPTSRDAVTAGIANLLGVVADNKYFLGRWLSQWAVGAPGLESAVAAAGIAQGHLGQARTLYPLVDDMLAGGFSSPDEGRTRHYCMSALDEPFATWAQAVATMYLVDPALDVVLRVVDPPGDELRRRVVRVLEESRFNATFARSRLVELTERWEHGRSHLDGTLRRIMPEALCWFGPPGEQGVTVLLDAGVLRADGEQMRTLYLDTVAPTLLEHGYDVGVAQGEGERQRAGGRGSQGEGERQRAGGRGSQGEGEPGRWTYEELPWERWNPLQRRLETTTG